MRLAALGMGVGLTLGLAGACQRTGDTGAEAPGRNAGAPARTETSEGEVSGNLPGMRSELAAYDTTRLPGVAGSGTAALGQPHGKPNPPGSGVLRSGDPTDEAVVTALDVVHTTEVEAAQVAAQKAQRPEVRQYAQTMLSAHRGPAAGTAAPATNAARSASDLLVPMREQHAAYMEVLKRTPAGPEFDRLYMTSQVDSHAGAHQLLTRLETSTTDRALLARIAHTEEEVNGHLETARRTLAIVQGAAAVPTAGIAGTTSTPRPPGSP
jgi:putative membrane protein